MHSSFSKQRSASKVTEPAPLTGGEMVRRVMATGIDFVLVPLISFIVMLVSGAMEHASAYAGMQPFIRPILLGIAGYLLVNGWLLYTRGQTVGKALLGLQVVDVKTGKVAAFWKLIFIRGWFFACLYLPIGYAYVGWLAMLPFLDGAFAFRGDRRCLHDLLCSTQVVRYRH